MDAPDAIAYCQYMYSSVFFGAKT